MIRVTHDHLDDVAMDETIERAPLYVMEAMLGVTGEIPHDGKTVKFQMYDDDGELYYSGELTDDDECENQLAALRWGETMAGCSTIKVRRGNGWEQEIG